MSEQSPPESPPELEVKQVIVYRRDLNMRKGKVAAQVAHASMKVFFDKGVRFLDKNTRETMPLEGVLLTRLDASGSEDPLMSIEFSRPMNRYMIIPLDESMDEWANGTFGKIVLTVETEEDLLLCYEEAKARNLPTALITDLGRTEFNGVPTNTAVAIGPAPAKIIDEITGKDGGIVKTRLP